MQDQTPPLPDIDQLAAGILKRIQRVCAHFTDEDLDRLVRRMAEIELKYWNCRDATDNIYRRFYQSQLDRQAEVAGRRGGEATAIGGTGSGDFRPELESAESRNAQLV